MRSSPSATLRDVLRKADPFYHRATCSGEEMKKKEREVEREALLGELCVDVPVLKELYQATKGSETWLSENRVQTNRLLYEADQKAVLEREGIVEMLTDPLTKSSRYVHTSRPFPMKPGDVKAGGRAIDGADFPMLEYEVPGSVKLRTEGWMVGEPPSEKDEKEEKETERKERSEASLDWGDGSSILQSHSEDSNVTGVDSSETRNKLRLLKRYRSPSAWFGVKTACIAGKERVTELRLSRNGLSGVSPLSPMLCRLEWLTHLDLSFNTFQSIRPPENERRIDTNPICPKGGITGWILLQKNGEPPHVTSRKHLDAISTGLRRLKYLNLSHNALSGPLPVEFGGGIASEEGYEEQVKKAENSSRKDMAGSTRGLVSLTTLLLNNNYLSGSVSMGFAGKSSLLRKNLVTLRLDHNKLSGNLQPFFPTSTSFEGNNQLLRIKGNWWPSLRVLRLGSNAFTGLIPQDIGKLCPRLEVLSLENNKLRGPLPNSVATHCRALRALVLSRNRECVGTIPDAWLRAFRCQYDIDFYKSNSTVQRTPTSIIYALRRGEQRHDRRKSTKWSPEAQKQRFCGNEKCLGAPNQCYPGGCGGWVAPFQCLLLLGLEGLDGQNKSKKFPVEQRFGGIAALRDAIPRCTIYVEPLRRNDGPNDGDVTNDDGNGRQSTMAEKDETPSSASEVKKCVRQWRKTIEDRRDRIAAGGDRQDQSDGACEAAFELAIAHELGLFGLEKDDKEAMKLYSELAEDPAVAPTADILTSDTDALTKKQMSLPSALAANSDLAKSEWNRLRLKILSSDSKILKSSAKPYSEAAKDNGIGEGPLEMENGGAVRVKVTPSPYMSTFSTAIHSTHLDSAFVYEREK